MASFPRGREAPDRGLVCVVVSPISLSNTVWIHLSSSVRNAYAGIMPETPEQHHRDALEALRRITDPEKRARAGLALQTAMRETTPDIRATIDGAVRTLRENLTLEQIGQRLGITNQRVSQMANGYRRAVAFAFRDESGAWHGRPDLVTDHVDGTLTITPDASARGFAGQTVTIRYGEVKGDPTLVGGEISMNTATVTAPGGQRRGVLLTHEVARLLAGDQ